MAYRTIVQTTTTCTPYNLIFDLEVMLPLEAQLPYLRVAVQFTDPNENTLVRLTEQEALDEYRLMAQQRFEIYQAQIAGAFSKWVKFRSFDVGELVLTIRRPIVINRKT